MVLKVFLLTHSSPNKQETDIYKVLDHWKIYYRPPWVLLIHMMELICLFFFSTMIISPTIDGLYHNRLMITKQLYPNREDIVPFSSIDEITETFSLLLDNLEKLSKKSFANLHFVDDKRPYYIETIWKNGTTSISPVFSFSPVLFHHSDEVLLKTSFYTYANDSTVSGCTIWHVSISLNRPAGSYCFQSTPQFIRSHCASHIVSDDMSVDDGVSTKPILRERMATRYHRVRIRYDDNRAQTDSMIISEIAKHIEDRTLEYYTPPTPDKTKPFFYRKYLTLFLPMQRFGIVLLVLSTVSFILMFFNLRVLFNFHHIKLQTDSSYKDLEPSEQFHSTIGLWNTFFLIKSVIEVGFSSSVLYELKNFSQYPSTKVMGLFGVSGFFTVFCTLRYFIQWKKSYRVILILKHSIAKILTTLIGQAPILMGFMFVAVFMFGFISTYTESFVTLFISVLALIFGDNVYGVFNEFTDGSAKYNRIAFIYVSSLIAVMIWVFFTSYTGVMGQVNSYVIKNYLK